ncbi:carbohydrate ABC transporter permease [uncultured Cellulomonas sp.]|uniref:carbohydrate ABC transporter permease n=1 Tax=uncultured Cellulomonas sp. TaxID=189682 RepID=UPI00262E4D87|nr:sugar ABC transporter permease [uncultured Cellulomonas sp.]
MANLTTPTVPEAAREKSRSGGVPRPRRLRGSRSLSGMLYAAPTGVMVLVFFVLPVLLVLQMSVSDWGLFAGNRGLNLPENYVDAADNRLLWPAIVFTVKYTVITTVLLLAVALGLAMVVQEASRWRSVLRTAILVPSALGLASASLLFYAIYSPQSSPINPALMALGVVQEPISFLGTPTSALWSTVFLIVWRFAGFYMLLLMVGLQGIPGDVYEAAHIDGANRWQIFSRITLPLLRPSLALCTILCVTGSLLAFDQFYILTKGGPDNSTITIVQLIYNMAFAGGNDLGLAAALSVMVLIALLAINALQFRGLRGKEN